MQQALSVEPHDPAPLGLGPPVLFAGPAATKKAHCTSPCPQKRRPYRAKAAAQVSLHPAVLHRRRRCQHLNCPRICSVLSGGRINSSKVRPRKACSSSACAVSGRIPRNCKKSPTSCGASSGINGATGTRIIIQGIVGVGTGSTSGTQ